MSKPDETADRSDEPSGGGGGTSPQAEPREAVTPRDEAPPREDESQGPSGEHAFDPRLLELLVCPLTKTTLEYDAERGELISRAARLAYPIRDGIPVMLPDEARRLDDQEAD